MNILFLLPYNPVPANSGNKNLTLNLLKGISERIHCDLVLLSEDRESENLIRTKILEVLPKIKNVWVFYQASGYSAFAKKLVLALQGNPPGISRYQNSDLYLWLSKHLAKNRYDLIHFDMIRMVQYRSACDSTPSLLIASDAYSMALKNNRIQEKNLLRKLIWFFNEKTLKKYEKQEYKKFSLVCTVSDVDRTYLSELIPSIRVVTIGIPVSNEYLLAQQDSFPKARDINPLRILCTGAISVSVVAQEIIDFIQNCYVEILSKVPQVKLTILGCDPAPALLKVISSTPNVELISYVKDYAAFLKQDWVYVYPQRSGSGLQTKVQQAMALGLPVVGFSRAFAGLKITSCIHGFECSSLDEMTTTILELLQDSTLRSSVGLAASTHVETNFSIDKVSSDMMVFYESTRKASGFS